MARRGLGKKKLAEVKDYAQQFLDTRETLRAYYTAIDLEYNYSLKLVHHEQAQLTKQGTRKPPVLQVSTLDLYDIIRYAAAQIDSASIYLDAEPVGRAPDKATQKEWDEAAEIVRAVMHEQVHDADLGYPDVRRSMIHHAIAARAGAIKLDVVPGGERGMDVVPSFVDPRDLSWDTRYKHFNKYGNTILFERVREVPLEEIAEDYPNGNLVKPDDGTQRITEADPKREKRGNKPLTATLVIAWEMEVSETVDRMVTRKLDPADWYMACDTCDYTERDLAEHPAFDGTTLPETMPCPQCGLTPEGQPAGTLHRTETERVAQPEPAYDGKKRRFVFAPFSPEAGYLEDGPWPKGLTRFPYAMYVPDPFPNEPFGNSATFLNMDMQSMKNATLAEGFGQMQRNRDRLIVKADSLWDAAGEPAQFDGTEDYVLYTTSYDDLAGLRHVQGAGLPQAYGAFYGIIDGEVNKHRGIGQASLSPEQMKGVQVGTIARSIETGDVPLDAMLRILREVEEGLFNRWLELLVANALEDWWVRVAGRDGQIIPRLFSPQQTPRMRLKVHASPNLDAVDIEKMKAMREMIAQGSPTLTRYIGQAAHLPPSMTEQLIEESKPPEAPGLPGAPGAPGDSGLPKGFTPGGGANGVPPAPLDPRGQVLAALQGR